MLRSLIFLLLMVVALPVFAGSYATDPQSPGRHWASTPGGICYENDKVIFECGALEVTREKDFLRGDTLHWKVVRPEGLYAKSPEGTHLTTEQANAIVLAQLREPFYDSAERKQVRFLGGMMALDIVATAAGLGGGVCSEAGPIAGHVPVLSVLISGGYFLHTRHWAKKTPRYFTSSKQAAPWVIGAEHGVAGIHNLLTCT